MLAAENRLTSGEDFRLAARSGVRAGSDLVVVHWLPRSGQGPVSVGFVVSKAVGNAVVRNRVKRRLRHLTREHLSVLPGSGALVVRARPGAATADAAGLESELTRCLERAVRRGSAGSQSSGSQKSGSQESGAVSGA